MSTPKSKAISELMLEIKKMLGSTMEEDEDDNEMEKGIEVEKEHTSDDVEAQMIASDHLKEDSKYYDKLEDAGISDTPKISMTILASKKPKEKLDIRKKEYQKKKK